MFPLFLKRNFSIMPFFVCLGEGPQWKENPYPIPTGPREKLFLLYHRCALSISIYLSYSYTFVYTHPPIPPKCVFHVLAAGGCRCIPTYVRTRCLYIFQDWLLTISPFFLFPGPRARFPALTTTTLTRRRCQSQTWCSPSRLRCVSMHIQVIPILNYAFLKKKNRFKRCLRQWGKKPSLWP